MVDKATILANMKLITEETNNALLNLLIRKAEVEILNYCNLADVPVALETVLEDLALYKYQLLGKEGLKSQALGSTNASFVEDIPTPIKRQLIKHRIVKVW